VLRFVAGHTQLAGPRATRAQTPLGRLARQWLRAYFKASRNSTSAATIYLFLSVGPLVLAATGLFRAAGGNANAVAREPSSTSV
jgi:hypothetical protein